MNLYLGFKERPPQWVLNKKFLNLENKNDYIKILKDKAVKCFYFVNNALVPIIETESTEIEEFEYYVRINSEDSILAWEYIELIELNKLNFRITIEIIQSIVCRVTEISENELIKNHKNRRRIYVYTRQLIMLFAYALLKLSLDEVGLKVGAKDHATVLHARKAIAKLFATKREVRNDIYNILKSLNIKTPDIDLLLFTEKIKIIH